MAKDDLSSFRISDVRRPEVRSYTVRTPQTESEPKVAVGFPAVEALLALDTVEDAVDRLRPTYEALEALSQTRDLKTRAAATKAMAAYERCADLFEYLFQTKAALQSPKSGA